MTGAYKGTSCPVCQSADLDRAPLGYPENGEVTAWVGCESCRHTWQETYVLTGIGEIQTPYVEPSPKTLGVCAYRPVDTDTNTRPKGRFAPFAPPIMLNVRPR